MYRKTLIISLGTCESILICELFGPLYRNLGITSTYEYLEARFSRSVRLHISVVFIVQNILYIGLAHNKSIMKLYSNLYIRAPLKPLLSMVQH